MKEEQLQIRVSKNEKKEIAKLAKEAGVSISKFILSSILNSSSLEFTRLTNILASESHTKEILAEINDFIQNLKRADFTESLNHPSQHLSTFQLNYLAGMIEVAAKNKSAHLPEWVLNTEPIDKPFFGSELSSLRLYLLANSPIPFRRRNIFIDSSVGDRV